MKVTKIRVSKGRTINTGNYNSVRYDFAAEANVDLAARENPEDAKQELEKLVDEWDEAECKYWADKIKKKS
jgi:hypothetical protein